MNTKGRYGYLVNILTTIADFILLNLVYILVVNTVNNVGEFNDKVIWLLLNISYCPAIFMFPDVHKKRILFADKLMIILVQTFMVHCLVMLTFTSIISYDAVPMRVYAYFYLIFYLSLAVWWITSRKIIKLFRRRGRNFKRIIIIGWNGTAKMLYDEILSDPGYGYKILGIFDNEEHADRAMTGTLQEIEDFVVANNIDEIYCAQPSEEEHVGDIIKIADRHDVQFFYVPLISGFMTTSFSLTSMGNLPIMVYRPNPLQFWLYRLIKRIFDICFSLVVIALVSVTVLIPIIFAIKLSSRGPVLFKQRRTGYRGREFTCLKFRTMKVNSQADTVQATKDDPRKTRVGDFLRRTSLDELPQFLNVLWGDMSVVGPRPHMVSQTNEYKKLIDKYMVRHIIKPGITGLAQVSGYRGQTEELWQMQKRVEYDVTYIENWSLWLDVKIIIRTIVNAILGEKNAF
ncbi:MAG: undecaprenyl-phosphate glucose phosphotransferase [Candidatus Limisoma sp.]|nr:undecaprenyl-phosphate glucose phosphotransferase [Bacteroidales bacterium]MDD7759279.1 undecaprenyl-phosphate glucose phosphotransferase [Bacteroidales bacterium]MDY5893873.1 undecaprenyl-phosphate glucose phosphotransferase [Candidatus Limisoma sp.]MDY5900052.1 undecaprenyl-phosphate glucose phosphotransferase [Candidatus Limisoma sp.]MDY5999156.1 undecaprenyl-phosphate glucose phosphotransferase [Candidatus Limisoma sp.]